MLKIWENIWPNGQKYFYANFLFLSLSVPCLLLSNSMWKQLPSSWAIVSKDFSWKVDSSSWKKFPSNCGGGTEWSLANLLWSMQTTSRLFGHCHTGAEIRVGNRLRWGKLSIYFLLIFLLFTGEIHESTSKRRIKVQSLQEGYVEELLTCFNLDSALLNSSEFVLSEA